MPIGRPDPEFAQQVGFDWRAWVGVVSLVVAALAFADVLGTPSPFVTSDNRRN